LIDDAGRFGTAGTLKRLEVSSYDSFGGGVVFMGGPVGRAVVMRWDLEGNPILPTEQPNPRIVPVPLKIATRSARSLRLLEGAVIGEIVAENQTIATIDNPIAREGSATPGTGGKTVELPRATRNRDGASFLVQIRMDSPQQKAQFQALWGGPIWPDASQASRGNILVKGLDANGQTQSPKSAKVAGVNDDGITQTLQLDVAFTTVPAKLIVVGPTEVAVEVPFRMENVPLP
jgi:hypothetical protein